MVAQLLYTETGFSWTHLVPSGITWTDGLILLFSCYQKVYTNGPNWA